ncbi:unnamed protein product, partial [Iphiclides podalirius]
MPTYQLLWEARTCMSDSRRLKVLSICREHAFACYLSGFFSRCDSLSLNGRWKMKRAFLHSSTSEVQKRQF